MHGSWTTFFATQAQVSAALTGLVFVALSINLKHILSLPGLAGRAGEALLLLLLPVLIGLAGILPQTDIRWFGGEVLGLGLFELTAVTLIVVAGHAASSARPRGEYRRRVATAEVAVLPTVVAGALLVTGHPGGLWWQAVGTGLCIAAGVGDAWVLLVEILRGEERPVIVRLRTHADVDACVAILETLHDHDGYPPFPPTDARGFLVSPDAEAAWVIEEDNEIVGHVALHRRSLAPVMALATAILGQPVDRLAVVARLFVSSTARRIGVGQMLLEVAAGEARGRGLWPILDVATSLSGAIRMYEDCGWTRAGEVTVDLGDGYFLDEFVFLGPGPAPDVR